MIQRETRQSSERCKESRRQANKILRKKKKAYLKRCIEKIEELNTQNENKKLYQATKQMTKGFQSKTSSYKDKKGRLIIIDEEVLKR